MEGELPRRPLRPDYAPSASASAAQSATVRSCCSAGTSALPFGPHSVGRGREGRAEADGPRPPQVVVVRGDHENSLRGHVQPRGRRGVDRVAAACRCERARPTGCGRSRARCRSPDPPAARTLPFDSAQTVKRLRSRSSPVAHVGPCGQPVPGVDEPVAVVRIEPQAALGQQTVQDLAVQHVDRLPGPPAAAHRLHRRLVPAAPSVGEPCPVRALTGPPVQLAAGVEHAAAPVDKRPEDVEGERVDRLGCQRFACIVAVRHGAAS